MELVTVNADPNFEFPGSDFYDELRHFGLGFGHQVGGRLEQAYRALLQLLALPLSPHGSSALIKKQIEEVCGRFRKYQNNAEGLAQDLESDEALQKCANSMDPADFNAVETASCSSPAITPRLDSSMFCPSPGAMSVRSYDMPLEMLMESVIDEKSMGRIEDIDEDDPVFVTNGGMCDGEEIEEETQKIPL